MSTGTCRYCGKSFTGSGMSRHIAACPSRKSSVEGNASQRLLHLVVSDSEEPDYWLHILTAPETPLSEIDVFLRAIWVECCGHSSEFVAAGTRYISDFNLLPVPMQEESESFDLPLSELPDCRHIVYRYDLGCPTTLYIRRLHPIESPVTEQTVVLAARNDPPQIECSCGAGAALLFARDLLYESFDDAFFCDHCIEAYDGDPEMLAPITNSPRMGVCGYYRSEIDPIGESPGFERAEFLIQNVTTSETATRLRSSDDSDRHAVIREEIGALRKMPVGEHNFRAARFISAHLEEFVEPLRELLLETLRRWDESCERPSDYSHVFALYLLARIPDGELFATLAPYFTRFDVIDAIWGETFRVCAARDSLWGSLCRETPELLMAFALERSADPVLRADAVNGLVALYLTGNLVREQITEYLKLLVEQTVQERDQAVGEILASACCTVYPDELIEDVQHLYDAGLLEGARVDYRDNARGLTERYTCREHLERVESIGIFSLVDDAPALLRELFREPEEFG